MVLLGGEQRIERDRHEAGTDRAPEQDGEIDRIEHDHRDAVLAAQPEPLEHRPDARGGVAQLAIGDGAGGIDEGGLAAPPLGNVAVDEVDGRIVVARIVHGPVAGWRACQPSFGEPLAPV